MKKPALTWLVLLVLFLLPGCARMEWDDIDWKTARCKFKMPRPYKDAEPADLPIAGKTAEKVPLYGKSSEHKEGAFTVFYLDLPAEGPDLSVKSRLDGAVAALRSSQRNAILVNKPDEGDHSTDNPPWKEAEIEWKDPAGTKMRTRMRVYLADRRLYLVLSSGSVSWVDSEDTKKFLDSFIVTKAPGGER